MTTYIEVMRVPSIRLQDLTYLILIYNGMVDAGERFDVDEILEKIKNKELFSFLKNKSEVFEQWYSRPQPYLGRTGAMFEIIYERELERFVDCFEGKLGKLLVGNGNGICVLIAFTNQIIQTGTGWVEG